MQFANPLPVFIGIPVMACFCWLLARRLPVLDEASPAHRKTLPLDGLRGILASTVFFHHAAITYVFLHTGQWGAPASLFYSHLGPAAVTLFFFISGYLFWRKMLKDPAGLRLAILIPNRIRRIMPAYLAAVLSFFLLAGWLTHWRLLVPLPVLCTEIARWICSGFPDPGGPSFNTIDSITTSGGIFWTLQQEWLFYLLLPCLAWFRPRLRLMSLATLLYFAGRLLFRIDASNQHIAGLLYIFEKFAHMFAFGFLIGMLAAYPIHNSRIVAALQSRWMILPGALLVVLDLFLVPVRFTLSEPLLLSPIFFMIVAGNDFGGLLSSAPLRALGTVSYSMYVFHGLILRLFTLLIDRHSPVRTMSPLTYWIWILPISLVVVLWSTLSYRFIERPFFAPGKSAHPKAA
jgi:peptidoglycan/LPS O-acetylase OafA/YrhL